MKKRFFLVVAVITCLLSLTAGCAIHLVPSIIPPLDMKTEGLPGPFDKITVSLLNAQSDDSNYSVKDLKGRESGWVLSRKLWTEKLAEGLKTELVARQATVVTEATCTISVKITDVAYAGSNVMISTIPFKVTADITSNSGWAKTYVGTGDASAWVPAGMKEDSNWNRASNWAIRDVVLAIMSDPEFISEISRQR